MEFPWASACVKAVLSQNHERAQYAQNASRTVISAARLSAILLHTPFCDIRRVKRALPLTIIVTLAVVIAIWWSHRKVDAPLGSAAAGRAASMPALGGDRGAADPQAPMPVLADDDPPGNLRLE